MRHRLIQFSKFFRIHVTTRCNCGDLHLRSLLQVENQVLTDEQQEQFTKLWTASQPVVNQYVASVIRDSWIVRDVVQSTPLALLRKFAEYDSSRPFLPWALGVARFEILSHRRDAVQPAAV